MKNTFKIVLLILGMLTFIFSCQKETDLNEESQTNQSLLTFKEITFKDFKSKNNANHSLLTETISKLKNSIASRGPNEANTYTIDSTNIVSIEHINGYSSYTFSVVSITEPNLIQNIFISNAIDGTTAIYLLEYETDIPVDNIEDEFLNEHITEKSIYNLENPTLNYANRIDVGGNGADCVSINTSTINYCEDADGNTIKDNGELGNGCYQNWTQQTVTTLTIDAGCLSGGGSGTTSTNGTTGTDGGNTSGGGTGDGTTDNNTDTTCQESGSPTSFNLDDGNCVDGVTEIIIRRNQVRSELEDDLDTEDLRFLDAYPQVEDAFNYLLITENSVENHTFIDWSVDYLQNMYLLGDLLGQQDQLDLFNSIVNQYTSEGIIEAIEEAFGDYFNNYFLENPEEFAPTYEFLPNDIINIQDYLDCFNNANSNDSFEITIYVEQPKPGERAPYRIINPFTSEVDVGHTFISLKMTDTSGSSISQTIGFYPDPNNLPDLDNPSTTGVFVDNGNHAYDISVTTSLDLNQFSNIINYLGNMASSTYDLNSLNCTDIGIQAAAQGGLSLPDTTGNWSMVFVGSGSGSNPGDLGEDIRVMNNTNITINTTPSNGPLSNGSCN